MKTILRIVAMLIVLNFSLPVFAAEQVYGYERRVIDGKVWALPDYINVEAFPPLGGKVSARDAKLLQLHLEALKEGVWMLNELRDRRTFEVIFAEKGTMVWASPSGEPRYLESCGNRISPLLPHQITMMPTPKPAPAPPKATTPTPRLRSLWRELWDVADTVGNGILDILLWPFIRYE